MKAKLQRRWTGRLCADGSSSTKSPFVDGLSRADLTVNSSAGSADRLSSKRCTGALPCRISRECGKTLAAPKRAVDVATAILAEAQFDLVWITLSACHIAGHWFLDPVRLPLDHSDQRTKAKLDATLDDAYAAVDEALSDILACLPPNTDLIVLSPSSMGPSASRTHVLPGMLQAVLGGKGIGTSEPKIVGISSGVSAQRYLRIFGHRWRVYSLTIGRCSSQLVWRCEVLTGRKREPSWCLAAIAVFFSSIYQAENGTALLIHRNRSALRAIASGLLTFRDPDGTPAVKRVELVTQSAKERTLSNPLPDLIVHWSDQLPPHLAGAYSPQFGEVPSSGWGSGRTGEHRDEAWAILIPGSSKRITPLKSPHIMDIVPTICSVLGVERQGLHGQPLLGSLPEDRKDA